MADTERLIAIPDIHGRMDLLDVLMIDLWENHDLDLERDRLFFLGDMIDRGQYSKDVVEYVRILENENPGRVIAPQGNHEQFAIAAHRAAEPERFQTHMCWMLPNNGGAATLYSYGGQVPTDVLDWFAGLPLYHEEPGFFFSHAPAPRENRRALMRRDQPFTPEELTWTYSADEFGIARDFSKEPLPFSGRAKDAEPKIVGVCGHIHALQKGCAEPRFYPHYIFADAGCGCAAHAPLVAIDVKTRAVIYARPEEKQ